MPPEAPVISAMGRVGDAAGDEALNVAVGGNGLTFWLWVTTKFIAACALQTSATGYFDA